MIHPADITLLALIVQGAVIGHGAVRLMLEPRRPRLSWLPLVLFVAYLIYLWLVPPAGLNRDTAVTNAAWLNTGRYVLLVLAFTTCMELLLGALRRQGRTLRGQV